MHCEQPRSVALRFGLRRPSPAESIWPATLQSAAWITTRRGLLASRYFRAKGTPGDFHWGQP